MPKRSSERRVGAGAIVAAMVLSLALYAASVGPAFWLLNRYPSVGLFKAMGVVYAPLDWVCARVPGLGTAKFRYIELFTGSLE